MGALRRMRNLPILCGPLDVLVVLGEHDRLVEAADALVDVAAHQDAEARRVRLHVLHEQQVEVHGIAGEQVAGVALDRLDLAGGDTEAALLELGDGALDPVGGGLVVGIEEEDQVGGGDRRACVAAHARHAAVDHERAGCFRDGARVVGGVRVGDDHRVGRRGLRGEQLEEPRQTLGLVEGGDDDGEGWRHP